MPLYQVIILAVVQGITEFLPISSSGHLVVISSFFEQSFDVDDINIVLHAGTLGSIVVYFWHRVWQLLGEDRSTIPHLIVATIPVGAIGVVVEEYFEAVLQSALLAGFMLIATGIILLVGSRLRVGQLRYQELSYGRTLAVGFAQAVAILPGISRSGTTITAGLAAGLSRRDAATFSFLMAIPAISGATLLKLYKFIREPEITTAPHSLILGALVSFVVGLFALWWLLRWLERGRLEYFAYWCIPVGIGVVAWQLASVA